MERERGLLSEENSIVNAKTIESDVLNNRNSENSYILKNIRLGIYEEFYDYNFQYRDILKDEIDKETKEIKEFRCS